MATTFAVQIIKVMSLSISSVSNSAFSIQYCLQFTIFYHPYIVWLHVDHILLSKLRVLNLYSTYLCDRRNSIRFSWKCPLLLPAQVVMSSVPLCLMNPRYSLYFLDVCSSWLLSCQDSQQGSGHSYWVWCRHHPGKLFFSKFVNHDWFFITLVPPASKTPPRSSSCWAKECYGRRRQRWRRSTRGKLCLRICRCPRLLLSHLQLVVVLHPSLIRLHGPNVLAPWPHPLRRRFSRPVFQGAHQWSKRPPMSIQINNPPRLMFNSLMALHWHVPNSTPLQMKNYAPTPKMAM